MTKLNLGHGRAICYSGFRQGQNPGLDIYPTYEEVKEDLIILDEDWDYIRLYDPSQHAKTVLEVIQREQLELKVMLGVCLAAESNNPNCPWGADYSEDELVRNKQENRQQIEELVKLAKQYPEIIFAVSAGNEATVDWSDHIVSVESIIEYVRYIKAHIKQPVTFCENYVPWNWKLDALVEELDFISLHTYPLWEYKPIHEALEYSKQNYMSVRNRFPDKEIVITEAGWATKSNGRGMHAYDANEGNQECYVEELLKWSEEANMLIFVFEAFDEDWKGSSDPLEPEKHWGIYTIDRKPKQMVEKNLCMN